MKLRLLTPGPTPVPEETLLDMARPVFYHRSSEFRAILAEVLADLKQVVAIFFLTLILSSYATEAIGIHALFGAFLALIVGWNLMDSGVHETLWDAIGAVVALGPVAVVAAVLVRHQFDLNSSAAFTLNS